MKTGDVEIKSGRQLTAECVEADPLAGVVCARIHDFTLLDNAGVQRHRVVSDAYLNQLCNSYKLSLTDPKLRRNYFHTYTLLVEVVLIKQLMELILCLQTNR